MAKAVPNPPPGFDELSVEEKIEYVESLWERIVATPEQVPVPDWHLRVLDKRLDALSDRARAREDLGAGSRGSTA